MLSPKKLSVEAFEDRITPTVTFAFDNGDLLVNGDGANDFVAVQVSTGYLNIVGTGVSFNGSVPFDGDVEINMGGGNDTVIFQNSYVNGDVTVSLEAGNDRALVQNASVTQDLNVNDGSGNDRIVVQNVYFGDEFDINFDGTRNGSSTELSGFGNDQFVFRSLSNGSDGDDSQWLLKQANTFDTLVVENVHIGERDSVNIVSNDAANVAIKQSSFQSELNIDIGNTLQPGPNIGSNVLMENFYVNGNLTIRTTNGASSAADLVVLRNFSNNDQVDIRTGGGQDNVVIEHAYIADLDVRLGGGNDFLVINQVSGQVAFLNGGGGNNTLAGQFWFNSETEIGF